MSPLRLVVCGTRFGEAYLQALAQGVAGVELKGILAQGSERSRQVAHRLGVPLWQRPEDARSHVDAAAVVIRSGALGGAGTAVAQAFLDTGCPVLMEHPVHPVEWRRLQDKATTGATILHVNSVYPYLEPIDVFIDRVAAWHEARVVDDARPAYVEATTSRQLLYSTLDILGRALGGSVDLQLEASCSAGEAGRLSYRPFADLAGTCGGLPLHLRLQSYLDRDDYDHHSLAMHRLTIGGPEGALSLASSFGPIVHSRPLFVPGYGDATPASQRRDPELDAATVMADRRCGPSTRAAVADAIPRAIGRALAEFAAAVRGDHRPIWQTDRYLEALTRAWLETNRIAGRPALRSLAPPLPPATIGLAPRELSE